MFDIFSRLVALGIYATPVELARAGGLLSFDIGAAVTALPIDTNEAYWQNIVTEDFTVSDYVPVPRIVASKGLSFVTVSGSYAKIPDSDITVYGGALDVPIINGGLLRPTLAVRAAYSQLDGVENYELRTYGAEVFLSKGFGPITPYGAIGRARSDAEGIITGGNPGTLYVPLRDQHDVNRYTVGVRLSLLIPKIVLEATQAEERSYSAKISFGL
jgi:hypothetical protein